MRLALAQQVKWLLVMSALHQQIPVWAALLSIHLPASTPRKAAEDGPTTLAPATHVIDQDGVPGS